MGGGLEGPRDLLRADRARPREGTALTDDPPRGPALLWSLGAALLPAAGLVAVRAGSSGDGEGLFRADLAALGLAVAVGAFLAPSLRRALVRLPAAALLAGLAHVPAGGSVAGAGALVLLVLAVAVAASGLAALGRRARTPPLPAGALAATVLWVAMSGLFWADAVSAALPRARQKPFREAVLHCDPATAAAYSAAGFDRLKEPRIYAGVPLASSLIQTPTAGPTGVAWLAAGLLAWSVALVLPGRRA